MNIAARTFRHNEGRGFYIGAVIGAFAIVFAGFARSYFLRGVFGAPPLTLLVHVHGLLMTGWFVLFFTQACLIAAHRVTWHRRLGIFGAVYAVVLIVVGVTTALRFAARSVHDPAAGGFAILILGYDLVLLTVFALLVGAAIALRRRSDFHKRLMLLATLSLLSVAIGRIPLDFIQADTFRITLLLSDLCVIVPVLIDTIRNRILHPVFAWGTLLVVASTWLAYLGVQTQTWTHFATCLVT